MDHQPVDPGFSLTPAICHILLVLADGERHGYAIMQAVMQATDGAVQLGPGTLYRSIRVMLTHGLIVETESRPDPALDDERRRYYCLTDLGKRVLQAEIERISRILKLAQTKPLLNPSQTGGPV